MKSDDDRIIDAENGSATCHAAHNIRGHAIITTLVAFDRRPFGLFRELKRAGHRLYFLSNMPPSYADHLERVNPPTGTLKFCPRCKAEFLRKQRRQAITRFLLRPFVDFDTKH